MTLSEYKSTSIFKTLQNDIATDKLNHSYLFYGQNSAKLKSLTNYAAKHIHCNGKDAPCNECAICKNIENEIFSDVLVYPKKGNGLKVDDAKQIVEDSIVVSFESNKKVIIINSMDNANEQSQNKLLKTLEEPVKNVVFLINAENISNVLNTIKSRTQKLFVSDADSEKNQDRQEVLKQEKMTELTLKVLKQMQKSSQVLEVSYCVLQYESEFESFVNKLQEFLADVIKVKSQVEKKYILNQNYYNEICEISNTMTLTGFKQVFDKTNNMLQKVKAYCNINLVLEDFLINFLEVRYRCQAS